MSLKSQKGKKKCMGGKGVGLRRRGSTLVEFALVVPILLAMLIGIVEFGVLTNYKLRVANATREGARYAALGKTPAVIRERIKQYCSPLTVADTDITLAYEDDKNATNPTYDMTMGTTTTTPAANDVPSGCLMRIAVNAQHRPLLAYFPGLSSFRLRANVVMRRE
jgi:Flp pilus assembly protein TadG